MELSVEGKSVRSNSTLNTNQLAKSFTLIMSAYLMILFLTHHTNISDISQFWTYQGCSNVWVMMFSIERNRCQFCFALFWKSTKFLHSARVMLGKSVPIPFWLSSSPTFENQPIGRTAFFFKCILWWKCTSWSALTFHFISKMSRWRLRRK